MLQNCAMMNISRRDVDPVGIGPAICSPKIALGSGLAFERATIDREGFTFP
jgi:hypothetical protein